MLWRGPYGWNFPAQFTISHLCSSQFQSFQTFHHYAPFITGISPFQSFQSFNRFAPFKAFQATAGSKRSKVPFVPIVRSSPATKNQERSRIGVVKRCPWEFLKSREVPPGRTSATH
jgi:hypothetical protein